MFYVEALEKNSQQKEALEIFKTLDISNTSNLVKSKAVSLHLFLVLSVVGIEEAKKLASKVEISHPDNIYIIANISRLYSQIGDKPMAQKKAEKALGLLKKNQCEYHIKLEVAELLYHLEMYEDAIEIYNDLIICYDDSNELRKLLICYYNTNQRRSALDLLNRISNDSRELKFYRRFGAFLYLLIGELKNALEEIEEFLKLNPDSVEFRILWIDILRRRGKKDKIKKFLSEFDNYSTGTPEQQIQIAHIFNQYGFPEKSIKLSYKLIRENRKNINIHLGYISLLLHGHFDEDYFESHKIDIGTAFTTKNPAGIKKTFIIENDLGSPNLCPSKAISN